MANVDRDSAFLCSQIAVLTQTELRITSCITNYLTRNDERKETVKEGAKRNIYRSRVRPCRENDRLMKRRGRDRGRRGGVTEKYRAREESIEWGYDWMEQR